MSEHNWELSRRGFLVKASTGAFVMLGLSIAGCGPIRRKSAEQIDQAVYRYKNGAAPTLWFEIKPDNSILIHSPKQEMGQGIFTGFAQIVADEMDADLAQIQVIHASTSVGPVDPRSTGASDSTSSLWYVLRELAASMRYMLLENASLIFGAPLSSLSVQNGIVSYGKQILSFGQIVEQGTVWKAPRKAPALKDRKEYRYIGKHAVRPDLDAKVIGEALFGMDASLPGMLYGSVVRPDLLDAELLSADTSIAERMPGVIKIIRESDFIGVVATSKIEADQAKQAIKVKWKQRKVWQQADIDARIRVGNGKGVTIQKEGSVDRIFQNTEQVVEAEYFSPIGAHAHLEPNGALADFQGDRIDIYISTQAPRITSEEVAERLGLKKEAVNVIPTYLGGGFGRRLHTPNAIQAALLSKAVGKPVQCFFDRKEEFQNDTFRPPTHHVMKASIQKNGYIEAIEHNTSSGAVAFGSVFLPKIVEPILGADLGAWRGGLLQYTGIPNYQAVSWLVELPFATSWWRSLGLLANTFAIESFMDELAHLVGTDPIQYRLDQIGDSERDLRLKKVIETARIESQWNRPVPNGRARGFACCVDANTPVAQVVEIVQTNHEIRVEKVTCVIDPGVAINPDGIRAQCEGAIIMGLSAAMFEEMRVEDGKIGPTIYGPYRMALLRHAPKEINTIILENAAHPSGVGEPPLGPIGAAIANAIFQLTGERRRRMPLSTT